MGTAGRHFLAVVAIVAASQNEGVARLGHLRHHLRRHDFLFGLGEPGLERVEFGVDAAQFGSGVVGEEVIQQALVLVFVALRFVLRQDVADGLVERQRLGVRGCQRAIVDAQAADVALERLVVVRIADRQGSGGDTLGLPASSHARGLAIE